MAPKTTNKSTSKEGINKTSISSKFSVLTDDNDDSVKANILSSKKRKPTHSDDEQILSNSVSRQKEKDNGGSYL